MLGVSECVCIGYVKCEVCVGDCVLSVWSMLDGVVYVWEKCVLWCVLHVWSVCQKVYVGCVCVVCVCVLGVECVWGNVCCIC